MRDQTEYKNIKNAIIGKNGSLTQSSLRLDVRVDYSVDGDWVNNGENCGATFKNIKPKRVDAHILAEAMHQVFFEKVEGS